MDPLTHAPMGLLMTFSIRAHSCTEAGPSPTQGGRKIVLFNLFFDLIDLFVSSMKTNINLGVELFFFFENHIR